MESVCVSCRSPRAETPCGLCEGPLCRKCRVFLPEDEFRFASDLPAELRHSYYCGTCHDRTVEPFRSEYEERLERARGVNVIYKGSKSAIRVVRKGVQPVQVADVADRDEALLRLAFRAAQEGFNAVIDVEVSSQKVRNEGWQKTAWSAKGLPAEITSHELDL